jgi:hypothetical protein
LVCSLTAVSAAIVYLIVPEATPVASGVGSVGLRKIYADPRFWRLAPLSAFCIGTAWALQGLWAAQWLRDVEGLDRTGVVFHLFAMAVALSLGAILLGVVADRLRRRGVGPEALVGLVAAVFIATQFALILRLPIPSYLLWAVVAAVGAATVLSFAILAEYFPKELAGRAEFVPHCCGFCCAVRDRGRASALAASSGALSRNRLSDGLCCQSRTPDRGVDLVCASGSPNALAAAKARFVDRNGKGLTKILGVAKSPFHLRWPQMGYPCAWY